MGSFLKLIPSVAAIFNELIEGNEMKQQLQNGSILVIKTSPLPVSLIEYYNSVVHEIKSKQQNNHMLWGEISSFRKITYKNS